MTTMTAMLLLALACYAFRAFFILLVPAERLPARVRAGLASLAPAVLAALVTVEVDAAAAGGTALVAALVVVSMLLVALVVRLTRSLLLAITVALAATLLIDLVVLG